MTDFRAVAESMGAEVKYFKQNNYFDFDQKKFIGFCELKNPKMIYICNPNNPLDLYIV